MTADICKCVVSEARSLDGKLSDAGRKKLEPQSWIPGRLRNDSVMHRG
jgi:hypothetical protein